MAYFRGGYLRMFVPVTECCFSTWRQLPPLTVVAALTLKSLRCQINTMFFKKGLQQLYGNSIKYDILETEGVI
jgi:hypothetical protein